MVYTSLVGVLELVDIERLSDCHYSSLWKEFVGMGCFPFVENPDRSGITLLVFNGGDQRHQIARHSNGAKEDDFPMMVSLRMEVAHAYRRKLRKRSSAGRVCWVRELETSV
jgi:hypothetical protein